jgi:hypothetical protein
MMSTPIMNVIQVADSLAPKAGRSKDRQEDPQGSTQVVDGLAPEARRSGLFQNNLALKARQSGCC